MMLRYSFTFFLLLLALNAFSYSIKFSTNACTNEDLIFARFYGKSFIPVDTATCNANMPAVFSGKEQLPEGLYAIILPDRTNIDVLITKEQNLTVKTFNDGMLFPQVTGSKQSERFAQYGHFIYTMQQLRQKLVQSYEPYRNNYDSVKSMQKQMREINAEVDRFYIKSKKDFKGELIASIFSLLHQTSAPAVLSPREKQYYLKNHFFNQVPFNDGRLANTPFLTNYTGMYLNNQLEQIPDTLIKYATKLIEHSKSNAEVFKQVCNSVFEYAANSKTMGMDKLLVSISKRYYLTGQAFWVDDEFKQKMRARVKKSEPTLLGKIAPKLNLMNLHEEMGFTALHDVKARFTLVAFWEPDCYYCNEAIPLIKKVSDQYPDNTLTVFAVCTQQDYKAWNNYIFKHDLHKWIHVYDKNGQSDYKTIYDITSTPQLFMLNEQKKIIAKSFNASDLEGIMKHLMKYGALY